ncbi:hypothetical protein COO19_25900, partial [Bacillus pseudomycoides]
LDSDVVLPYSHQLKKGNKMNFHRKRSYKGRISCQIIYTLLNCLCIFYYTVLIKGCFLIIRYNIGTVFACIKFKEGGMDLRNK